jgi:PAS domain S-box-containing protein
MAAIAMGVCVLASLLYALGVAQTVGSTLLDGALFFVLMIVWVFNRKGLVGPASVFLILAVWLYLLVCGYQLGGSGDPLVGSLYVLVLAGALLLGGIGIALTFGLTIISSLVLLFLHEPGRLPGHGSAFGSVQATIILTVNILLIFALVLLWNRSMRQAIERSERELKDRRRAEQDRLKFELGAERSKDAIFLTDTDGGILYVNPAFERLYGWPKVEVIGQNPRILKSGVLPGTFYRHFWSELMSGKIMSAEIINRTRGGNLVTVEASVNPIVAPDGTFLGFLAIQRDITDRKRAEERLRLSEERFRNIVDSSPMGIHMYSLEEGDRLIFTGSNPAADAILGVENKQFIGKTLEEAFPALAATNIPEAYRRVCREGVVWDDVQVNYDDDKIHGAFEIRAFQTSPRKMGVMFADVTDRKRVQEEIRQREERLRSIVQNLSDIVTILDARGKVVWNTPSVGKVLGLDADKFIGRCVFDYMHPDDALRARLAFEAVAAGRVPSATVEIRFKHATGKWITLESVGNSLGGTPETLGVVVTSRDITERKMADQELLTIARGVSSSTGSTFFRSLTEHLAKALDADVAFIGELIGSGSERVRTTAVYRDGGIADNFEYQLAGTPCENVMQIGTRTYPSSVADRFPEDRMLRELSIEGYVGTSLADSAGKIYGILVVLFRHPIVRPAHAESLLTIFAARAAAELERKQAEDRITGSLREKEVLLKEIHHRVKNNMQVINSLLSLQADVVEDARVREQLRDSQNRVRTMALVHETLYRSGDLGRIPFRQYLENLFDQLWRSYAVTNVQRELAVDSFTLGIDQAIPCGLIVNELVSNSLKHAFPGGAAGKIIVAARDTDGGRCVISVRDDGPGFPEALAEKVRASLGMELVRTLVEQLEGSLMTRNEKGAVIEISFPRGTLK